MFCQHFTRYVISDINHKSSLISIPISPVWDRETISAKLRFREESSSFVAVAIIVTKAKLDNSLMVRRLLMSQRHQISELPPLINQTQMKYNLCLGFPLKYLKIIRSYHLKSRDTTVNGTISVLV